jgi:hypothetical protein
MHRRIDSSSLRSDPSANGYIDLNFSAQLHLTLQHQCTAPADLDDSIQLRPVPQCSHATATSSTTSTSRGGSAARQRLLQLREKARRPAGDHFDFARTIDGLPTTISTTCLDLKTSRNRLRLVKLHQRAPRLHRHSPTNQAKWLIPFPTCSSQDRLPFWVCLSTGTKPSGATPWSTTYPCTSLDGHETL